MSIVLVLGASAFGGSSPSVIVENSEDPRMNSGAFDVYSATTF